MENKNNTIKVGDKWSRVSYGEVIGRPGSKFTLKNEDGFEWYISKELLEKEFMFHNHVEKEVYLTKTELAEIFIKNSRLIMTVNYNKQIKEANVVKELIDLYPNKKGNLISKTAYAKNVLNIVKNLLVGEERTIIGRHYGHQDDFGRINFIDMEKEKELVTSKNGFTYDKRSRLVDPRTINWMIVDGIKYMRK